MAFGDAIKRQQCDPAEITRRVNALFDELGRTTELIRGMKDAVPEVKRDTEELKTKVEDLEKKVDAVKADTEELKTKTVALK